MMSMLITKMTSMIIITLREFVVFIALMSETAILEAITPIVIGMVFKTHFGGVIASMTTLGHGNP